MGHVEHSIEDIAIILVISFFLKSIIAMESVLRPRRVVLHNEIKDRDNIDRVKMIIPDEGVLFGSVFKLHEKFTLSIEELPLNRK